MSAGYVYVLKTRSYPHLKIGCTTRTPEERAAELSGTSLPHPFKVVYSVAVNDCRTMERQIHDHFADQRVASNRELFALTIADAIAGIDHVIKTTTHTPKAEPEPEEEMLRIAHHPNSPPPHNTHMPTNRFAEDILQGGPREKISTNYPLLYASLKLLPKTTNDERGWYDNYTNLKALLDPRTGDPITAPYIIENTLQALVKAGYRLIPDTADLAKDTTITVHAYEPKTRNFTVLNIGSYRHSSSDWYCESLCGVYAAGDSKPLKLKPTKRGGYA